MAKLEVLAMSDKSAKTYNTAISRRRFLEGAGVAGLAATLTSLALITPAQAKVAQSAVMYRSRPNGTRKCSGCKFFQAAANTCERVKGEISPNGWCAIWRKK